MQHTKTKKILLGYLIFSLLAGIGLAVWRTILLYRFYDPFNDSFSLQAQADLDLFGYVMFACLILALTSLVFLRKQECKPFFASSGQFSIFSTSLLGCLFVAAGILTLGYYADELFASDKNAFYSLFLIISLLMLFLSAIYFILNASARYDGTFLKKTFSFAPTLFAISYLGAAYLSPDFIFSDSNDILRNVSLAALAFFFMQETRACFYGKSDILRFPFSVIAIIALLAYELPALIVTAFWEMEMTHMTMFELVECGAIIYAVTVAVSMRASAEPKKDPLPEESKTEKEPEKTQA